MEVDITSKAKNIIRFGLLSLVILAVMAGGGVYFYQHYHKSLTVYDAKVTGTTIPTRSSAAGTITEILVHDGDHVEAGEVIARIETNVTDEQIQQLQQNLDLTKKNLEQLQKGSSTTVPSAVTSNDTGAQQRAEQAYSRLQRMNELFSMGAISAVKRDEAAAEYAAAQAAASQYTYSSSARTVTMPVSPEIIQQAEAQAKQAEAALANARSDQKVREIIAPVAGTVVLSDDVGENSMVKAGQIVANLMDSENMWLEATVSSEQAKKIRLGQFASYALDKHSLQGSVKDIINPSEKNDASSTDVISADDGRIIVRVSIPSDLSFTVKPGMTTAILFTVEG